MLGTSKSPKQIPNDPLFGKNKNKRKTKQKTYTHNVPNTDPKAKQKTSKHAYYQKNVQHIPKDKNMSNKK